MINLLMNVARLLRLQGGPQNLPPSWSLTIFLVSLFLMQNILTGQQFDNTDAAARTLVALSLQIVILAGLLAWRRHPERFSQTLSALVGVGIVFNLLTSVLLTQSDPEINQPVLAMTWFGVFIWSLFVDAHIYRHALSMTLTTGMLVTVLILAMNYILLELML